MKEWFYLDSNNQQNGPFTIDEIKMYCRNGILNQFNYVWKNGMENWKQISEVNELRNEQLSDPLLNQVSMKNCILQNNIQYAGFWMRFIAALIDGILLSIIGMIFGAIAGGIVGAILGAMGISLNIIVLICTLLGYIIGIILNWAYFTFFESSSKQATLGKMALRIKVTDSNINALSFGKANARYWSKILSVLTLFIGFIMAGFTEKKQALHDKISDCLVIKK